MADAAKPRSAPVSWLLWLGKLALVAPVWCFRIFFPEKKPLSRAQEKQRRKAMVRELKNRK
jgi:hypothetical protein